MIGEIEYGLKLLQQGYDREGKMYLIKSGFSEAQVGSLKSGFDKGLSLEEIGKIAIPVLDPPIMNELIAKVDKEITKGCNVDAIKG